MQRRPDHRFHLDDAAIDASEPPDFDWTDNDAMFKAMGIDPPKTITPEEYRNRALRHATTIFKNFEYLAQILVRHEQTIQKRWLKKTKEQKRKVLLKAWGNDMNVRHRPDFKAVDKESSEQRRKGTAYRDAFLWPDINQEDLTKPKPLLLLLNSRGRNQPADFAAADFDATALGRRSNSLNDMLFLNLHTVMLTARTTPETYGQLYQWNEHPESLDWMTTRKGVSPGEGMFVLEIQDRILAFLVKCCEEILHDVPPDSMLAYPIQPEPKLSAEVDTGFESLAVMAAEAPYRVPAKLSFTRIESLLSARKDAVADHVWSLREDPTYFATETVESKEHSPEMLRDLHGNKHPLFVEKREHELWGRVLREDISNAWLAHERWTDLHKQSIALRDMQASIGPSLDPDKPLPRAYMYAILRFRYDMNEAAKEPFHRLSMSFTGSPQMRSYFAVDSSNDLFGVKVKPGLKLNDSEDYLIWLISTLASDSKSLFQISIPLLVDELQRHIESDVKAKALISPLVAGIISDLSIIAECLRQLDLYQPWANGYNHYLVDNEPAIQKEYEEKSKPWARLQASVKGNEGILARYGTPTEGRFHYPIGKRRCKENVDALRAAEANLDAFWTKVDELLHKNAGDLQGTALRDLLSQPRILQRTPEWVETKQEESKHNKLNDEVEALRKPLSEIWFDLQHRTESTVSKDETKALNTKQKTRGAPDPQLASAPREAAEEANPLDPQPTFEVDQRAAKVFRTLFHTPSAGSTPGEVPWTDFLHAMASVGFRVEKLYGSVWQFSPTRLDVEQSIQIHDPHPSSKIQYWIARRHGRRLNRKYGWYGGMFKVAEKKGRELA